MTGTPAALDKRYHLLDHWRGAAALGVLIFHGFALWFETKPALVPAGLVWLIEHGSLGVYLFFVISGYCITERAARVHARDESIRGFITDRLLRIYPPYWAALIFVLLLNIGGAAAKGESPWRLGVLPSGWHWVMAVWASEPWGHQPSYLPVAWTLAYEIGFYLIAAAGLGLARASGRPWVGFAWGGALCVAGMSAVSVSWMPLLTLWPHFFLGAAVWLALNGPGISSRRLALGGLFLSAFFVSCWLCPEPARSRLQFASGCALLLLLLKPWDVRLARLPTGRWIGWIGTFAYSLYLIHEPIVSKTRNLLGRWRTPADGWALLGQSMCCVLAVAAAWLFYRLIEVRCEAYRKSIRFRPDGNHP